MSDNKLRKADQDANDEHVVIENDPPHTCEEGSIPGGETENHTR